MGYNLGGGGGGAAGSIVVGNAVTGGTNNTVLYIDNSGNLGSEAAFGYVASTDTLTAVNIGSTTITNSGLAEFSGQTNISGPDATTNVEIGSTANDANAGTGGTSVVIGNSATNSGNAVGVVIIGSGNTNSSTGPVVVVGVGNATGSTGLNRLVLGNSNNLSSTANGAMIVGSALTNNFASAILGVNKSTTANNQLVFADGVSGGYNSVYFGEGITDTSAVAVTINGTGGSGSDNAGGGLSLAGGIATGSAAGGNVALRTSARSTTSSTPQTLVDRYLAVAGTKTLTAGAATGVVRIGVPQGLTGPVGITVFYGIRASDGTDFQIRRGSVHIAAVNKAGTETAVISAASEAADGSVLAQSSASTLTYGLTVASNAADTIDFEINAVSGLTETTLDVCYSVIRDHGVGTITPL